MSKYVLYLTESEYKRLKGEVNRLDSFGREFAIVHLAEFVEKVWR